MGVNSENQPADACRFERDLWKVPVVPSAMEIHAIRGGLLVLKSDWPQDGSAQ